MPELFVLYNEKITSKSAIYSVIAFCFKKNAGALSDYRDFLSVNLIGCFYHYGIKTFIHGKSGF